METNTDLTQEIQGAYEAIEMTFVGIAAAAAADDLTDPDKYGLPEETLTHDTAQEAEIVLTGLIIQARLHGDSSSYPGGETARLAERTKEALSGLRSSVRHLRPGHAQREAALRKAIDKAMRVGA
jgi:hypothetical protein